MTAPDDNSTPELGLSPADVATMPAEALPGLVAGLTALLCAAASRLLVRPAPDGITPVGADSLVSVAEAARRTGMSRRWLYLHARRGQLPFARRIGRAVRFSPAGIDRWLSSRNRQ